MSIKPTFELIKQAANQYNLSKDDYDDMAEFVLEQAQAISERMSLSEREKLGQHFGSLLIVDSLDILTLDEPVDVDYATAALFFLIAHSEPLKGCLDLHDYGIAKWEEVEDNSWDWFYSELVNCGLIFDNEFYFLVEINNQDSSSETKAFATIKTQSRDESEHAALIYAQVFHSGEFDDTRKGFVSDNVLNQAVRAVEISESEVNTMKRLSIGNHFDSMEALEDSCDMDEVNAALAS